MEYKTRGETLSNHFSESVAGSHKKFKCFKLGQHAVHQQRWKSIERKLVPTNIEDGRWEFGKQNTKIDYKYVR